jgi:hypothetical protein
MLWFGLFGRHILKVLNLILYFSFGFYGLTLKECLARLKEVKNRLK